MSARIDTIYDRDVDRSDCGLVCAPFRVRTELRHAPPPHQTGWREPAACASDSVQLDDFRMTSTVERPIGAPILRIHRQLTGANP